MRKKRNYTLYIFIGLILLLSISFFTPFSSTVKNYVFSFTFSLQKTIMNGGNNFLGALEIFQNTEEIKEKNAYLQSKNNTLKAKVAKMEELEKENESLREALNLESKEEKDLVFAEMFGADLLGHQINVRYEGEINTGNPVITSEGILVGTVSSVYKNFAKVDLVTSKKSSFEVKVQNEDNPIGVLQGKENKNLFLDLLPPDKNIKEGDKVITLPREGMTEGGILVGEVIKVYRDSVNPFKQAEVKQFIDHRFLNHLFIIKN